MDLFGISGLITTQLYHECKAPYTSLMNQLVSIYCQLSGCFYVFCQGILLFAIPEVYLFIEKYSTYIFIINFQIFLQQLWLHIRKSVF